MTKFFLLLSLFFILSHYAFAQSDGKNQIQNREWPDTAKKIRIFKGIRIINAETNETLKKHILDFRVTHLFGNMGKESGGGFHNFFGFDQSKDIRIAFEYGITDWWTISVSRSKRHENLEASGKFKSLNKLLTRPHWLLVFSPTSLIRP